MSDTRTFYVACTCMATYNSSVQVPANYTFEQALDYAREHIDEIPIEDGLEYISGSDEIDEENCEFEEIAMHIESRLPEIYEEVKMYFEENLPQYIVLQVRKKSYHPDDSHLYMISAKKDDGTSYAVWTCYNQKTKSLNHGHYGLQSQTDCEKVMKCILL